MRLLLVMLLMGAVAPGWAQAPAGGGTTYHVARKIPIGLLEPRRAEEGENGGAEN